MLLLSIICCENIDCDIYNVFYCLYIECEINISKSNKNSNNKYESVYKSFSIKWRMEPCSRGQRTMTVRVIHELFLFKCTFYSRRLFVPGDCSLSWCFYMTSAGVVMTFICASLAFHAPKRKLPSTGPTRWTRCFWRSSCVVLHIFTVTQTRKTRSLLIVLYVRIMITIHFFTARLFGTLHRLTSDLL